MSKWSVSNWYCIRNLSRLELRGMKILDRNSHQSLGVFMIKKISLLKNHKLKWTEVLMRCGTKNSVWKPAQSSQCVSMANQLKLLKSLLYVLWHSTNISFTYKNLSRLLTTIYSHTIAISYERLRNDKSDKPNFKKCLCLLVFTFWSIIRNKENRFKHSASV